MQDKGEIHGIPYIIRKKNPPKTRRYYQVLRYLEQHKIPQMPFKEAIEYILSARYIPDYSKKGIKEIIIYPEDRILALRCEETEELFNLRWKIAKDIGWYPYITGVELKVSLFSKFVDEHAKTSLDEIKFDIPITRPITLQAIATGSKENAYLLKIGTFNLLLDCALQNKKISSIVRNKLVDAVFISHAHDDHAGSLLKFVEEGFDGPILMTATTADYIVARNWHRKEILKKTLEQTYMVPYEKELKIDENVRVTLYRAGHIPGSSMIFIKVNDFKILYTGDFFLRDRLPMGGGEESLKKIERPIDVFIFDATFCNKEMDEESKIFNTLLSETEITLSKNGVVLISSTPGSYDLVLFLKFFDYFTRKGWKPSVYMEPKIIEYMKIIRYRKNDQSKIVKKFIEEERDPFSSVMRKELRGALDVIKALSGNSIIISFPHNLSTPPITNYLEKIHKDSRNMLVLTGAQRLGAGKEILEGKKRILIRYSEVNSKEIKEKEIELKNQIFNKKYPSLILASHADSKQLISALMTLQPKLAIPFHASREDIKNFFGKKSLQQVKYQFLVSGKEITLRED